MFKLPTNKLKIIYTLLIAVAYNFPCPHFPLSSKLKPQIIAPMGKEFNIQVYMYVSVC